jgi:predicted nucleic acid-binding protein
MIRYALDTSVMLRWFTQVHDADTERALRLREEQLAETIELTVLDHSIYELLHVLKESANFDRGKLDSALTSLDYLHLNIVPYSPDIMRKATQIACEHYISIYAACFIALGAHLRCQAVTCDQDLFRKVSSLPWTLLLASLTL